jgi:thioredoxin reductase (NADPH)
MEAVPPVAPIETDAVIVGAGPVGLFQVFELGLLEVKAHIIDSLPYPGGQCIHLGQEVTELQRREDGRFDLATAKGTRFITKTVFIAGGVGAFQPRLLKVDGIEKHQDRQIFYRVKNPAQFAGKHLVIVGGGDSALDWTLNFAQDGPHKAESVILIHRRDGFRAAPASVARMKELCDAMEMQFVTGQITGIEERGERLTGVKVTGSDGVTRVVPLDVLLVFFGLSPKLGPIAEWGLALERKQVVVDTEKFETSLPGIFAVGDINTYPGKKKLILSGFHEAALAAFGAAPYIFPDKRIHLQYTTTSPKLHKVLGVETPTFDD